MTIDRKSLRSTAALFLFATVLSVASVFATGSVPAHANNTAEEVKSADVIVQFGETDVIIRPISFTGEISGLMALELAGIDFVTEDTAFGPAVCSIGGVGCPDSDCFCSSEWWGSSYWNGSDWEAYMVGAGSSVISETGSVEGWRWGAGETPIPASQAQSAQKALQWLAEQQLGDGSYNSQIGGTLDAMMAVAANSIAADEWRTSPASASLLDFAMRGGSDFSQRDVASAGKLAVALSAGQGCWPASAMKPSGFYSETIDSMSDQAGYLSWGILGTVALSDTIPGDSAGMLKNLIQSNGGWEYAATWGADTNTTSLAIQALVAAGESITSTEVLSGLAYLKAAQNDDGGFAYQPGSPFGTESDANSTSIVIQALLAAGEDPRGPEWTQDGNNGYDYLSTMQLPNGAFEWQPDSGANVMATEQAIPALLSTVWPAESVTLPDCNWACYLPVTLSEQ